MNKIVFFPSLAAAAFSATAAFSSTVQHDLSFGIDVVGASLIEQTDLSLGAVINYRLPIPKDNMVTSLFGEKDLFPVIKGDKPRYQRQFVNQINGEYTTRPIHQRSENRGKTQECFIPTIPDQVIHIPMSELSDLSQEEIIHGIYFGSLVEQGQETREENPEFGVGSNAQYSRTGGEMLITQAGHTAKSGFVGIIGGNDTIQIIESVRGTEVQNASAYMTVTNGMMNAVITGQPFVTVQNGNYTTTISVYDTAPDASQAWSDCKTHLENLDVQKELAKKERVAVTFKNAPMSDEIEGHDRIENILTSQARNKTYTDLQSGVEDLQTIALGEATGVLAGYPYGLDYMKELDGNRFSSYGCYLKQEYTTNGEIVSRQTSISFLKPEETSCIGGEFAKVVYPSWNDVAPSGIFSAVPPVITSKNNPPGSPRPPIIVTGCCGGTTNPPEEPPIAPVSLPASLPLTLAGLGGLALLRRRRSPS